MINIKIIIFISIIVFIIGVVVFLKNKKYSLTYYNDEEYPLRQDIVNMFNEEGIFEEKDLKKAYIYIPINYTNVENEYKNIPFNNHMLIHAIQGCDKIADKLYLSSILKKFYGVKCSLIPKTFDLKNNNEIKNLLEEKECVVVLKKNIQRQRGLKFIKLSSLNLEKLKNYSKEGYVIAQKALYNPYIIDKRKINIRYYLLIVIENNVKKAYLYNNGFIYYTKKDYNYSTDFDSMVTTGYIDRSVYEKNPLTHEDLYQYIKKSGKEYSILRKNVKELISKVLKFICFYLIASKGRINYQLFGIDIEPDYDLNVKLIEINKGPSTTPMDNSRDSKLKSKLQKDIYKTIGVFKNFNNDNDFEIIGI